MWHYPTPKEFDFNEFASTLSEVAFTSRVWFYIIWGCVHSLKLQLLYANGRMVFWGNFLKDFSPYIPMLKFAYTHISTLCSHPTSGYRDLKKVESTLPEGSLTQVSAFFEQLIFEKIFFYIFNLKIQPQIVALSYPWVL